MMKWILLFFTLLFGFAEKANAQFVAAAATSCTAITCSVTLPSSKAGGEVIVGMFVGNSTAVQSLVDQYHVSYTLTSGPTVWSSPTNNFVERLYTAPSANGGALTISVTMAASVYVELHAFAYDTDPSIPIDVIAGATTGTGTGGTNSITTKNANDILFAFFHSDGGVTNVPGNGFTGRMQAGQGYPLGEDLLTSVVGTTTAAMNFSASANWVGFLIALRQHPSYGPNNSASVQLTLTVAAPHTVLLSWSPGTNPLPITGYNIYRSQTKGGPYVKFGTTTSTTYTDNQVSYGLIYYYVVTAYSTNICPAGTPVAQPGQTPTCWAAPGESAYSNEAVATIPLSLAAPSRNLFKRLWNKIR